MKYKNFLINISLILSSIYLPLIIFSSYENFRKHNTSRARIVRKRIKDYDIPQKISAINAGFIPTYLPDSILKEQKPISIYPIGSLPKTRSYLCNEGHGFGLITYLTDRFGLRNKDEKWLNINNKSNIFVIGDSHIHGYCVTENFTIPSILEKSNNLNSINLASGSNSPYEYMAILKSIVMPIVNDTQEEQIVIVAFYANDHIASHPERYKLIDSIKPILEKTSEGISPSYHYTNSLKIFINKNYPQPSKEVILNTRKKTFKQTSFYSNLTISPIRKKLKILLSRNTPSQSSSQLSSQSPSEKTISLLSEICKDRCKPFVVYIPNSTFWDPMSNSEDYKPELKEMSKTMGIPFIDGSKVINGSNREDFAPKGPHLSLKGYKKLADFINNKILD
tara:strand:- start:70 stop:1248 length:1179 start_codon:yes stop_codon:yes gene_type:complete